MAADRDATLRIQERFVSIQGEGSLAGTTSRFIRVSGCNLRCAWCDSPATSWSPTGERISVETLVADARQGPRHVVLTGGEPLLFSPASVLTQRLRASSHHVTVETAGSVWLDGAEADLWSISPKLAHSEPHHRAPALAQRHAEARWRPEVIQRLMDRGAWQLKFVVRAHHAASLATDVEEIESMLSRLDVPSVARSQVFLMPECTDPQRLSADYRNLAPVVADTGFRLGLRLHLTLYGHTPGT